MPKAATHPRKKPSGWGRFFIYVALLIIVFLVAGFFNFVRIIQNPTLPSPLPKADGVVVWTGKGGGRLGAGARLLSQGYGERLLISGVNENNSRDKILDILAIDEAVSQCCVDLDYDAQDTVGNARETAIWSEAMGYEHIILVTSAYHMPRAELEIAAARGRLRITPYPVVSEDYHDWWKDSSRFKRVLHEYGKLVFANLRHPGSRSHRGAPILEKPDTEPPTNTL